MSPSFPFFKRKGKHTRDITVLYVRRRHHIPRDALLRCSQKCFKWEHTFQPFPWQNRNRKPKKFCKLVTYVLWRGKIYYWFILQKCAKISTTQPNISVAFLITFLLLSLYFITHYAQKNTDVKWYVRIIVSTVTYSSFCVLNLTSSACRPKFCRICSHHM